MSEFWPFVLGIVVFLVGLAISIALHELGHLIPAKLFGVKVSKYMIGFGPTLFSRTRGETQYGLKAIPLGGYIAMAGMYPPAAESTGTSRRHGSARGFFGKIVQDARDVSAESAENVAPERLFYNLPVWKRIVIMLGGPVMNLILGFVLFAILLTTIGSPVSTTTLESVSPCIAESSTCSPATPDAPGALAGLEAGDTITQINGDSVSSWEQVSAAIRSWGHNDLAFTILRDGQELTLVVSPQLTDRPVYQASGEPQVDEQGEIVTESVPFVGISPRQEIAPRPVTEAFTLTGQTISGTAALIVTLPQRLVEVGQAAFGGEERHVDGPISVVGVGRVAGEITGSTQVATEGKVASLLGIMGSLNIALFVFNLIPLLPLDGGHIAGALWEYVRRGWAWLRKKPRPGPVDIARLMPLTFVVVVVLIAMSALLIYADIVKPVVIL